MLNINRNNYESIFIDYLDGNLSEIEVATLKVFLVENPDLNDEFNYFDNIQLESDNVIFKNKSNLKKNVESIYDDQDTYDNTCVAKFEGDLSITDEIDFDKYLDKNKQKRHDYNLFTLTKLTSDKSVFFTDKHILRKTFIAYRKQKIFYTLISMAASILIFFSAYIIYQNTALNNKVAENNYAIQNNWLYENFFKTLNKQISTLEINKTLLINKNKVEEHEAKSNYIPYTNLTCNNNSKVITAFDNDTTNNSPAKEQLVLIESKHINLQLLTKSIDDYLIAENIIIVLSDSINSKTINEIVQNKIRKKILKDDKNQKISIWNLAEAAARGISKLTGKNISFDNKYNDNGKIEVLALTTDAFEFAAKIRKKKN